MATADDKRSCFIIMPISTSDGFLDIYEGDKEHFQHVLEHLLVPAVEELGYRAIPPMSRGSQLIHADIVANLASADLVLCDMSTLNANVFFELGIRSALDRAVALVVDDRTTGLPFDTTIINRITYPAILRPWNIADTRSRLVEHLKDSVEGSDGRNALWKYFGVAATGDLSAAHGTEEDKLALILRRIEFMARSQEVGPPNELERSYMANPVEIHFDHQDDFLEALKLMNELRAIATTKEGRSIPIVVGAGDLELVNDFDDTVLYRFFREKGNLLGYIPAREICINTGRTSRMHATAYSRA